MRSAIHKKKKKKRFLIRGIADYIFRSCGQEFAILLILNKEQILCVEVPQLLIENFHFL